MGFDIGGLAQGVVDNTIGAGLGLLLEKHNDKRQLNQQQKLTNMQLNANKEMAGYNYDRQLQMWKDTNYGAQKEQLEKAGLNPGLMYGMGGGGGVSTGGGGGGISGGQAPSGGGEVMGMLMQRAQLQLMEAQTEKTKAEATNIAGPQTQLQTAQTASLTQGISNQKAVERLTTLQGDIEEFKKEITGQTVQASISMAKYLARQAGEQLTILENEAIISSNTWDDKINLVKQQLAGTILQNELTKHQINKTDAEINKMAQDIIQGNKKLAIDQFKAEIDANNPGLWNTIGGELQNVLDEIYKLGQDTRLRRKMPEQKK